MKESDDMENQFSRTEMLISKEGVSKLNNSKIVVFGVGGVGSYVVEGLARAGVGNFILIDHDTVSLSNINRQLIALHSTIGKYKVDVAKERILDINPNAKVEVYKEFFMPDSQTNIFLDDVDYVVDCVDTVTAKIEIIKRCKEKGIPIISSMGTGNKLDPSKFVICDIKKTNTCPLAKVMRKELRKRNIDSLKVLYSKEEPTKCSNNNSEEDGKSKKVVPGSISFVPSVAGLMIAGEVVRELIFNDLESKK